MSNRKFKYGEYALLKKGHCNGIYVKIGIRFDSKVHSKRNPSGISYYVEGYDVREWCFEEELRKIGFIIRLIRKLRKKT